MAIIDKTTLDDFVNKNIDSFHSSRLTKLEATQLNDILKTKNPYLFKAKNLNTAAELVTDLLEAVLSSSEEKFMGGFP